MQLLISLILMAFALEAAFGTPLGPLTRRLASTGVPATFGESKPSIRMAQLRSVISLVEQTRKLKTTTLYKWSREVSVYGFDSVAWIFSTNFTRALTIRASSKTE
ncbi:hypothetical protein MJO28_002915 [Puccinia striiformis f. sp. tritici]|uniref:Uncharacterized protein n=1 Tax=Puccinia striiformis f. sp. tritici TaxID=168172 RepID=A0ACC0ES16_9BASI|nr:hypothetical protein MJO28_002915 [Puccinia striiformis f. sp. tritici]